MKISFFDDEPELFPLQYGGKARTIMNLAQEFIKRDEVEKVTILSRSIFSNEKKFEQNNIHFLSLDDNNTIKEIKKACDESDIINIHCCSFTFPNLDCRAKKIYFLHDVLIATADKGSHLDKALGGNFDYIVAPSEFAKKEYDKNRKIIDGKIDCKVIPRHINKKLFAKISIENLKKDNNTPEVLKTLIEKNKKIIFFPSRPIEEKGGKYIIELAKKLENENTYIVGPFDNFDNLPKNCINTGWIKSEELKYYYSAATVTCNFSLLPESFSQVCIESIYCGTPVVAFASGNIPNFKELTAALYICNKDIDDIEEKVKLAEKLKNNEEALKKEQEIISKEFDVDKIIDKYLELYKEEKR